MAECCDGDLDPKKEIHPQRLLLENIEIVYVPEKIDFEDFEEFNSVFARYNTSASSSLEEDAKREYETALSKKNCRKMSVADLKKNSSKPDVVDKLDATAPDPKLLVYLKSYRNTVPVPRHWSQKKKFLQGKRGIEKQPYQLPDYIAATGIEKMREAYINKGDSVFLHPEMNIDYQVFYDAFFENQTKPKLTTYGDLYYEGKEFEEIKPKKMEPAGMLSREVKEALDIPEGAPPPHLDLGASLDHQPGGCDQRWGELVD